VKAIPVRLEGRAGGTFDGTLQTAKEGNGRAFTSRTDLSAARLRVQGIPAERLQGSVDYRAGEVEYKLEGRTLGGSFTLDGKVPAKKEGGRESTDTPACGDRA